jgi:hypothetical protein
MTRKCGSPLRGGETSSPVGQPVPSVGGSDHFRQQSEMRRIGPAGRRIRPVAPDATAGAFDARSWPLQASIDRLPKRLKFRCHDVAIGRRPNKDANVAAEGIHFVDRCF